MWLRPLRQGMSRQKTDTISDSSASTKFSHHARASPQVKARSDSPQVTPSSMMLKKTWDSTVCSFRGAWRVGFSRYAIGLCSLHARTLTWNPLLYRCPTCHAGGYANLPSETIVYTVSNISYDGWVVHAFGSPHFG